MDALKDGHKCDLGVKSPGLGASSDLLLVNVEDKVTTQLSWAERMKLDPGKAADRLRPVKVGEATEAILQQAFTPLKNADWPMLRRQFLVPDLPITMAPKLNKVMSAECQIGVKSTNPINLSRFKLADFLSLSVVQPINSIRKRCFTMAKLVNGTSKGLPIRGLFSSFCLCLLKILEGTNWSYQ